MKTSCHALKNTKKKINLLPDAPDGGEDNAICISASIVNDSCLMQRRGDDQLICLVLSISAFRPSSTVFGAPATEQDKV